MMGLCPNHKEMREVHEDFMVLDRLICVECGNKIIELIGKNMMKYLDKLESARLSRRS